MDRLSHLSSQLSNTAPYFFQTSCIVSRFLRDRLFDLLNDSEGMGADSLTGELAGKGRVFRRRQNCREMPAGTAYHYKGRNKVRTGKIKQNEYLF